MQLKPRYGNDPIVQLGGEPSSICVPAVRQARRLGQVLETLTDEQWHHPSRCEHWTVRDVIVHLGITNQFWAMSVTAGLAGDPTTMMANFDPALSPLEMGAGNVDSPAEVLAKFLDVSDTWCSLLEGLSDEDWLALGEAPPGHVPIAVVAHHALWDSWVHERDILLPLGQTPVEEADEVSKCLRYSVALGATLELSHGADNTGTITFQVDDPADAFTLFIDDAARVESSDPAADPHVQASAVPLLEAISMRVPMPITPDTQAAWLFDGIKRAFDQ